ncbi:MAG: 2-hydroxy-3-oxopropionate reductase [Chloroflexi bacterium]|nr:2-hydroxy-3-oxopropionate reductase [Chloroflexota bacterium]
MERIGFIGLGAMGKPMARNLMNAGYLLNLFTRTRAKVEDLLAAGAIWYASPKEIAQNSDVVITNLPDTPDVEHAFAGKDGVFDGARPGMLFVDMGTTSPVTARKLAQDAAARGCEFLDAPVSGGDIGAQNATLTIMVGGTEAAFARALPILQKLGKTITLMGDAGAGQITKAANQIITSINIEAVSEALVFAAKAGVDPAKVRQALLGGSAYSRSLEFHGQRMLDHNFKPGFRLRLHRKDLDIVMAAGKEYGVSLPITAQVREMMTALMNAGRGDWDTSSMVTHLEGLAQKEIKSQQA